MVGVSPQKLKNKKQVSLEVLHTSNSKSLCWWDLLEPEQSVLPPSLDICRCYSSYKDDSRLATNLSLVTSLFVSAILCSSNKKIIPSCSWNRRDDIFFNDRNRNRHHVFSLSFSFLSFKTWNSLWTNKKVFQRLITLSSDQHVYSFPSTITTSTERKILIKIESWLPVD